MEISNIIKILFNVADAVLYYTPPQGFINEEFKIDNAQLWLKLFLDKIISLNGFFN